MKIEPRKLDGDWAEGWALDIHTLKSVPLDEGRFDTIYPEVGKALHQLKYENDWNQLTPLAVAVSEFLKGRIWIKSIDVIVPVPPSERRVRQPVQELADSVGNLLDISVSHDYLQKIKRTKSLKAEGDPMRRKQELAGAFVVADGRYAGKNILLLDDIYRSGVTLQEITGVLRNSGGAVRVYVQTLTKTRTKR